MPVVKTPPATVNLPAPQLILLRLGRDAPRPCRISVIASS